MKKTISIRLDPKMINALEYYKSKTGISVSVFIRTAIVRELIIKGIINFPKRSD